MTKHLAYFGPAGTFTEEAALAYDPQARLIPFATIPAVASAVETGMADEGIVPIENSLEGSVPATLDLLIHESTLFIRQELILPINQHLMVKPGTKVGDVKTVYSHPQPLGQCRRFLERCFPKAQLVASLSTAAAVEQMLASDHPAAAIGPRRAAELYGAEILASNVQDEPSNETRFVVLAKEDHQPTGKDKTSLCFYIPEDRPGALVDILFDFSHRGINLAKIESRPSRESLGKYIFLVDLEGHRQDSTVAEALGTVRAKTSLFKVFGSYPKSG
ncbi:MAG: prephenate dehydratase [Dehalococcoidia bacterium]|nr:prephenate dehydratase [Dehalococcoidia bacterium]